MNQTTFNSVLEDLVTNHQAVVTAIALRPDAPTVFLLDEHHGCGPLIDDNVAIAKTLIRIAAVALIGVEGCEGDEISLGDLMNMHSNRFFGGRPRFASAMLACPGIEVVGVDSPKLCNEITDDCQQGKGIAKSHPSQMKRSEYMVNTMHQKLKVRPTIKAAIINAGADHNDRIQAIVLGVKDENCGAVSASFVRVRSSQFPV